jgi:excisionase family DNA binding protein
MTGLLRKRELAKLLNVSINTINFWMRLGKIPFLKLGGGEKASLRFDPQEIKEWIRTGKQNSPSSETAKRGDLEYEGKRAQEN